MPKINLNKKRVLEIVGKKLTDRELNEKLPFLGTDLEEITEKEIEVETFPDRPDLLSEEGFARALKAYLGLTKSPKEYKAKKSSYEVNVEKSVEKVRPYTVCAVVKNLNLNEEKVNGLIQMQEKLHLTHGRGREKAAIGIYPLEKMEFPINYKALKPSEIKFKPLESEREMNGNEILEENEKGKEYKHLLEGKAKYPVFTDANNNFLSMPPIINSEELGRVNEGTENVFVECSGNDLEVLKKTLNIVCATLSDMEGEVYEVKINYGNPIITPDFKEIKVKANVNYINSYLGLNLTEREVKNCLKNMNVKYKYGEAIFPSYRVDVIDSIDVVEDVGIGYGYQNFEDDAEKVFTAGKEDELEIKKRKLTEYLVGSGLIENESNHILNKELQEKTNENNIVTLLNSVSSEHNSMRKKIIHSLLHNLHNNKNNVYPQKVFEMGTVYEDKEEILEKENISVLLAGDFNLTNAIQYLELIGKSLNIRFELEEKDNSLFIEGRSCNIKLDKKIIGVLGEINPSVLELYELEVPVAGFEMSLNHIFEEV